MGFCSHRKPKDYQENQDNGLLSGYFHQMIMLYNGSDLSHNVSALFTGTFELLFSVGHSTCPDKIDFPIKEDFADKRSYITPTVAWARNEFIQTDLTKLFQKARRLPGK